MRIDHTVELPDTKLSRQKQQSLKRVDETEVEMSGRAQRRGCVLVAILVLLTLLQFSPSSGYQVPNNNRTLPRGQYRYLVSVSDRCNGALITPTHVLTTADCVDPRYKNNEDVFVRIGVYNLRNPEEGRKVSVIEKMIHERLLDHDGNYRFDMAILVLSEAVEDIDPIRLPAQPVKPGNQNWYKVVGWQPKASDYGCAPIPNLLSLKVADNSTCKVPLSEETVCIAQGREPRPCTRDCSGSLLVKQDRNGSEELIGIGTFHYRTCSPRSRPRLFTLVASNGHLRWIREKLELVPRDPWMCISQAEPCK